MARPDAGGDTCRSGATCTFRYWYDYSGGTITDWGAHHNDIAAGALGLDGPVNVEARRWSKPIPGGFTAASQYDVEYTYANGVIHLCQSTTANSIFGAKGRDAEAGRAPHGVMFEGADGWIYVSRGKIEASDPDLLKEPLPAKVSPAVRQQRPHGQLLRVRPDPQAARLRRRGRPPLGVGVPPRRHRDAAGPAS